MRQDGLSPTWRRCCATPCWAHWLRQRLSRLPAPAEPLALTVADKRTECVDGGKWQTRHLISATASVICAASARRLKGPSSCSRGAGPCPGRFTELLVVSKERRTKTQTDGIMRANPLN